MKFPSHKTPRSMADHVLMKSGTNDPKTALIKLASGLPLL